MTIFQRKRQSLIKTNISRSPRRQLLATPDVTFSFFRSQTETRLSQASKLAMSGVEETSSESVEVKEDTEFDVEAEDHLGDGFVVDHTRYIFYR